MSDAPEFEPKQILDALPDLPGVYRMLDASGEILYVGKAKSLKKRVASYFQRQLASPRIALMVTQIAGIDTTVTRTEAEALLLENNLIKRHQPPYNIVFRDDKSYPYIQLSNTPFPQLAFFRGTPEPGADHFGPYPSAHAVRASIGLLQKLFRLRTCSDAMFNNRARACLLYQIRRCSGPCVGHVDEAAYARDVDLARLFLGGKAHEVIRQLRARMEAASDRLEFELAAVYRDQIAQVGRLRERQFVTGTAVDEADVVVAVREPDGLCLNIAMVRFGEHLGDKPIFPQHARDWSAEDALGDFLRQHYGSHPVPERIVANLPVADEVSADLALLAGREVRIGLPRGEEQRAWVEMAEKNARLALEARRTTEASRMKALEALRDVLQLDDLPQRVECFDISHTQGETPVASCVVCVSGAMTPGQYRRFNITGDACGDDFASIAQAVRRRYEKAATGSVDAPPLPDLVVIDGGAGQLAAARQSMREIGLDESIAMIGIAKGAGRKEGLEKIVFDSARMPLQLPLSHAGFRLLIEIRNEAHRFAISGHRAKRSKARRESVLDELPGIGPRRRRALLTHFGSLAGVQAASVDQLAGVDGISRTMATQIYQALH